MEEDINTIIVKKYKSWKNLLANSNISILPYFELSKPPKYCYINIMSF